MAGFRKGKAEQAFLKMALYGPPGSGKTFTALLVAEGLASLAGKRVAYIDTERGTDFYVQAVAERQKHPEAFDIDVLYTRSLTESLKEVGSLNLSEYGVVVIDSVTHLWEACKAAYTGKMNRAGQIPLWAWQGIKKPYKDFMALLLKANFHVLILGRQGSEFGEDETGEQKQIGYKMKAEPETAYEPHICFRMESVRHGQKNQLAVPTAHVEKDRSGILQGKSIPWPSFDTIARPLLGLLGGTQAALQTEEEAGQQDAEALAEEEHKKDHRCAELRRQFEARFLAAETRDQVEAIGKEITAAVKRQMNTLAIEHLRGCWQEALNRVGK